MTRTPKQLKRPLLLKEAEKERNWHCRFYEECLLFACKEQWQSWSCRLCPWKGDKGNVRNDTKSTDEKGPFAEDSPSTGVSGEGGSEEDENPGDGDLLRFEEEEYWSSLAGDGEWSDDFLKIIAGEGEE